MYQVAYQEAVNSSLTESNVKMLQFGYAVILGLILSG